ncbi:MAG: Holliday junction branch migration protein RuvA, partial [Lachnospiraceae bacterium]|nr:Holliday junction branch migration protein RuvA [Lachnospiraceae bacterium]
GVGPKGAQAILSVAPVPTIKYFIVTSDVNSLSKAPTIGKKTAERIIVDLKDKLGKEPLLGPAEEIKTSEESGLTDDAKDAIEALVALGYDRKDAKTAVLKVENLDSLNTNDILKLALQYMF